MVRQNGYDNENAIMLKCNYRSHDQILLLSSKLFYDGKLVPCADSVATSSLGHWHRLPVTAGCYDAFPVLFVGVRGQQVAKEDADALENIQEVCIFSFV